MNMIKTGQVPNIHQIQDKRTFDVYMYLILIELIKLQNSPSERISQRCGLGKKALRLTVLRITFDLINDSIF